MILFLVCIPITLDMPESISYFLLFYYVAVLTYKWRGKVDLIDSILFLKMRDAYEVIVLAKLLYLLVYRVYSLCWE